MKKVIVTNASGGSGKDTFCKMVGEYIDVCRYSYVEFTRQILSDNGIDTSEKTDKDRQLLATVNNALEKYNDIPFKDICELIDDFIDNTLDCEVLMLDIREPRVIDRLKTKYKGITTLYIDNGQPLCDATLADLSVKDYLYDINIDNTGTLEHLKEQAKYFAKFKVHYLSDCKRVIKLKISSVDLRDGIKNIQVIEMFS